MLLTSTDKLQANLGEVIATAESDFVVWYFDSPSNTADRKLTKSSGVAAVDIAAAPGAGVLRQIKGMFFKNRDTIPHTLRISYFDGTAQWQISPTLNVPVGYSAEWTNEQGWLLQSPSGLAGVGPTAIVQTNIGTGSPIALTTGTIKSFISLAVPVGTWDMEANICFIGNPVTNVTRLFGCTGLTLDTLDQSDGLYADRGFTAAGQTIFAGSNPTLQVPRRRFTFAAPVTFYATVLANFTVNTCGACGTLWGTRVA